MQRIALIIIAVLLKLLLLTVLVIHSSCKRVYTIPKESLKLIPYNSGDKLIFQSNEGTSDTLYVVDVNNFIGPNDPLGVNADEEETYEILVKKDTPNVFVNKLMSLTSTEKRGVIFEIGLTTKESKFYGESIFSVNELEKKETLTQKINGYLYEDLWLFEATNREYEDRDDFVEKIYWSKSRGLVRYDMSRNRFWVLVN